MEVVTDHKNVIYTKAETNITALQAILFLHSTPIGQWEVVWLTPALREWQ